VGLSRPGRHPRCSRRPAGVRPGLRSGRVPPGRRLCRRGLAEPAARPVYAGAIRTATPALSGPHVLSLLRGHILLLRLSGRQRAGRRRVILFSRRGPDGGTIKDGLALSLVVVALVVVAPAVGERRHAGQHQQHHHDDGGDGQLERPMVEHAGARPAGPASTTDAWPANGTAFGERSAWTGRRAA
jgi:hypothetical protein